MQIIGNPSAHLRPGNFSERIENGQLALPEPLVVLLKRSNVATAEAFISHLRCYPRALAENLSWSAKDVSAASRSLFERLQQVAPLLLKPQKPTKRSFGVR